MSQEILPHDIDNVLMIALTFAFERTNTNFDEKYIKNIIKDVRQEFPNITPEDAKAALRCGGLGRYGRTYRMSTQEVCLWIRTYLKDNSYSAPWD